MNSLPRQTTRHFVRHARRSAISLLCVGLVLSSGLWSAGCGWPLAGPVVEGDVFRLPLGAGHPLVELLRGTAFQDPTALELNLRNGAFRLQYSDAAKSIAGQLAVRNGGWEMRRCQFKSADGWGTLDFDPGSREIVCIRTSDGLAWESAKAAGGRARTGDDRLSDYLAANAELIAATSQSERADTAFAILPNIVTFILFVGWFCAGTTIFCPGLPQVLAIIAALLAAFPPPIVPGPSLPQNNPPTARADAFTTPQDTPVSGNVLADNGSGADSDPDGDALTASLATNPSSGTVTLAANGDFTYTPNAGFVGADSFTYDIDDGNGGTDTATVTITVTSTNNPPDARDDEFEVFPEDTLNGNLFADNGFGIDSDPDGDTITIIAVNGVAANVGVAVALTMDGEVTVNADGSFEYVDGGFSQVVQIFTYTISDGRGGTDTATVTITIIDD